jgi:hypothetical protein
MKAIDNKSSSISYSRGVDAYDNNPLQREAENFDAFETAILADRSPEKGKTFFCGPVSFGPHDRPNDYPRDDHYRLATHALPRRFLAVDHDGFRDHKTFESIYSDLVAFRGFGYTTWSHTEEAPRARAVFELSRDVTRAEGLALGSAFDRMIEGVYGDEAAKSDKSVHKNEQPIYAPGPNARIFHFGGDPLDVDALLKRYPAPLMEVESSWINERESTSSTGYARLTLDSLTKVLGLIDCTSEPTWNSVSNALARAYGESAREVFRRYSKGEFWGAPYPGYDEREVEEKYNRSLRELNTHPHGYGVRHLIKLSGLRYDQLDFDEPNDVSVSVYQDTHASVLLPELNSRGKPLQTSGNLASVLATHSIVLRYNQIAKACEVLVPGLSCVPDETSNTTLTFVIDLAVKAGMTPARIPEMIDALASQEPYCPVQGYIDSRPWDGLPRFSQFTSQMTIPNPGFAHVLIRKWLIQCVAAAYEPYGIANAGVLIMTGAQGIGKTSTYKDLVSGVPGAFLEGQTLNPADKDSVMTAVSHWVVELGEMDSTFKKADLAQLKAFITKTQDTLRRPYARKDSVFPRRTVFAGTVNDFEFLHDPTGNRRFWPIQVDAIARDVTFDYQQLWAEAKTWYEAGEKWYLSVAELKQLEQYSDVFMTSDPDVELLLSHYQFAGCTSWVHKSMKDICIAIGLEKPTKAQFMRLAAAILKRNGNQRPRSSNGVKYHYVPAHSSATPSALETISTNSSFTSVTSGADSASLMNKLEAAFSDS